MSEPTGRLLELLGLFQRQREWGGPELAVRLGVTDRTVRRDIGRLRDLGYPVKAVPGAAGGYQLGRGGRLPPLLLSDSEALAVGLGLRAAVDGSVSGMEDAALAVLTRLEDLLPLPVSRRMLNIHASTAEAGGSWARIESSVLSSLAAACARSERVRFGYTDRQSRVTNRLAEPYKLVKLGPRWYLVARDVDRKDWRTFRLDRMVSIEQLGTPFELAEHPDAAEMVRKGVKTRQWPYQATIRVEAPFTQVEEMIPGAISLADEGVATVVELGAMSEPRMMRYLSGLPAACEVLEPASLKEALVTQARMVLAANS